jgi:hypothetical protein
LGDTRRRLRNVQILREGQRNEARERGIIEGSPPDLEVRLPLTLPALDTFLTEEAIRQGNLRLLVVRADRATRQKADTQQKGERAGLDEHNGPFGNLIHW